MEGCGAAGCQRGWGDLPDRGPGRYGTGGRTSLCGEPDARGTGGLRVRDLDPDLPAGADLRRVSGPSGQQRKPASEEDRVVLRPGLLLERDLGAPVPCARVCTLAGGVRGDHYGRRRRVPAGTARRRRGRPGRALARRAGLRAARRLGHGGVLRRVRYGPRGNGGAQRWYRGGRPRGAAADRRRRLRLRSNTGRKDRPGAGLPGLRIGRAVGARRHRRQQYAASPTTTGAALLAAALVAIAFVGALRGGRPCGSARRTAHPGTV